MKATAKAFGQLDERILQEDGLRLVGENIATVAHELRSPLMGIRAQLQVMQRQALREGADSDRFAPILEQLDTMSRLCDQVLSLSRGVAAPVFRPVDMTQVCMDTAALLRAMTIAKGVTLTLKTAKGLPPVTGDEDMLRRLLINLVSNAIDAAEGRPRAEVTVALDGDGKRVRLAVSDNGCGMDAVTMERIFTPRFSTKKNGGGLGLPICVAIAKQHRACFTVFSKEGKGSCFCLLLPAAE
ncbi:MAG: HAMP domain-containing histidine kinase [Firmicutes bacterium]|nr:HAMP domain-containing histidine kinase [Bacillota bacterium]